MSVQTQAGSGIPGPRTRSAWEREQPTIGPGLQQVVLWSQLSIARGEGTLLFDQDGRRYLDFFGASGVNSIGHAHPHWVEAMTRQMSEWTVGGFGSNARVQMLDALRAVLPPQLDRVQLYSTGAEAVEAALRLAKSYTKKFEFLSFWNGFHGKTMGALALTDGEKRGLGPAAPGFHSTPYAYCSQCTLSLQFPACEFACVDHGRERLRRDSAGALAGVIVEPVQGRAGNLVPPEGYMKELRRLADDHEALLIIDETLTGFGRTGRMFCFEYDGVMPDIMIVGKGMGGGYPVTAVISSSKIMSAAPYANPSHSSSSYGGFPVACRAVHATLEIFEREGLVENAATVGAQITAGLRGLMGAVPMVRNVQGRGLMIGIELGSPEDRRPLSKEQLGEVYKALARRGLLVMVSGSSIRLYPPLNVAAEIAREAVGILDEVLREQSRALGIG